MTRFSKRFWEWYERHERLHLALAAALFLLQIIHLYWLAADVIAFRLFGQSFFAPSRLWEAVIAIVDYTEIPAILTASLVYLHEVRSRFSWRGVAFFFFINSQWLHLFWITDEVVVSIFKAGTAGTILPLWLAWAAIVLDYLELPVMLDITKKFYYNLLKQYEREK